MIALHPAAVPTDGAVSRLATTARLAAAKPRRKASAMVVTAWRFWSVTSDGTLYSPYSRGDVPPPLRRTHVWRGGGLTSWCGWSPGVRPHPGIEAPQEGCDCGVRACTDLRQLLAHDPALLSEPNTVVGLVDLSGIVLGVGTTPPRWRGAHRPARRAAPLDPSTTLRGQRGRVGGHLWCDERYATPFQRRHPWVRVHPTPAGGLDADAMEAAALTGRRAVQCP